MGLSKYNGIFVLVIVAGLMFAASSCTQTNNSGTGNPYVGGSSGLTFSFVPGSPPAQIYDNQQQFSVDVRVNNNGEFDVNHVFFNLYGVSSA